MERVALLNFKGKTKEHSKTTVVSIDFEKKQAGHLHIYIKDSLFVNKLVCNYGPYKDFIIFKSELTFKRFFSGKTHFSNNGLICAKHIEIVLPPEIMPENIDVYFESKMFPVTQYGYFNCDDELLNKIFDVCKNTIHICMLPHYYGNSTINLQAEKCRKFADSWRGKKNDYVIVDGARRDREVWVGDLLPEMRSCWSIFKEAEIIKNSFEVILCQMEDDGYIPACSISMQKFLEYNCWFIIVFYEYILFSGDYDYLYKEIGKLQKIIKYIENELDEDGLLNLGIRQTWAWTLKRQGLITSSQCVLYKAFECASKLFSFVCDKELEKYYKDSAEALANFIRNRCYDKEEKLVLDVLDFNGGKVYSLDANCFALIFDLIDEEQKVNILSKMKEKFWTPFGSKLLVPEEEMNELNWVHNKHIWPFVVSFEVEARLKHGDYENAYELIKNCWGTMLEHNADTFWEIIDGDSGCFMTKRIMDADDDRDTWNSASHGWSAGVAHLMQCYITGVYPLTPGFAKFSLNPHLYKMTFLKAAVPAPMGEIMLEFMKIDFGYSLRLEIPHGLQCIWNSTDELYNDKGRIVLTGDTVPSGEYRLIVGDLK